MALIYKSFSDHAHAVLKMLDKTSEMIDKDEIDHLYHLTYELDNFQSHETTDEEIKDPQNQQLITNILDEMAKLCQKLNDKKSREMDDLFDKEQHFKSQSIYLQNRQLFRS